MIYKEGKLSKKFSPDNEKHYKILFEQSPDSIMVIDPQGKIIECNKSGLRLSGYKLEEILKLKLTDLMDNSALAVFREKFPRLKNLEQQEAEIKLKTKKRRNDRYLAYCSSDQ